MTELLVTWIAPTVSNLPQLAWLNELGRIENIANVRVTARTGDKITHDDVAAVLQLPAHVLVWSGHGVPGGLLLNDNQLVRPRWLASQLSKGCRPSLVILAACSSQNKDENLRSLTEVVCRAGITVVGFPASADDLAAGTFTVECIRTMSTNSSVMDAFDVGIEAVGKTSTAQGVFLTPGLSNFPFMWEQDFKDILNSLARIERRLEVRSDLGSIEKDNRMDLAQDPTSGIRPLARTRTGYIRGLSAPDIPDELGAET